LNNTPQSSSVIIDGTNSLQQEASFFLRTSLYKEYLRRLRLDLDSNQIKASELNSEVLIRINDSFLLGNSSERIAGKRVEIVVLLRYYVLYTLLVVFNLPLFIYICI